MSSHENYFYNLSRKEINFSFERRAVLRQEHIVYAPVEMLFSCHLSSVTSKATSQRFVYN